MKTIRLAIIIAMSITLLGACCTNPKSAPNSQVQAIESQKVQSVLNDFLRYDQTFHSAIIEEESVLSDGNILILGKISPGVRAISPYPFKAVLMRKDNSYVLVSYEDQEQGVVNIDGS